MQRINVYADPAGDAIEGSMLAGWFDPDKATRFDAETEWDGHDMVDINTGSNWIDESLYLTAKGRWVLEHDAHRCDNSPDTFRFVTMAAAREWLLRNHHDEAVERHFGPVEEERGPGRPEVGPRVEIRVPQAMLAKLDAFAAELQVSRAEAVRRIVERALEQIVPAGP